MLFAIDGQSLVTNDATNPMFSWINPYALIVLLCGSSLACGVVCCVGDIGHSQTHDTVMWLKLVFLSYMAQLIYVGAFIFPTTSSHCRVWTVLSWIAFQLCRKCFQAVLCFRKPQMFLCFGTTGSSNTSKTVRFAFSSCLFGTLISSVFLLCSCWNVTVVSFHNDMWPDFPLWRNDALCATTMDFDLSERVAFMAILFWSDSLMSISLVTSFVIKCWKTRATMAMESVSLQSSVPTYLSNYDRHFDTSDMRQNSERSWLGGNAFGRLSHDHNAQKPTTDLLTVRARFGGDVAPCAVLWLISLGNLILFVFAPKYTYHLLLCDSSLKLCVASAIVIRSFIKYTPVWGDEFELNQAGFLLDVRGYLYSEQMSYYETDLSDSDMITEYGIGDYASAVFSDDSVLYDGVEGYVTHSSISEEYESFGVPALQRRKSSLGVTDLPCADQDSFDFPQHNFDRSRFSSI